MIDGLIKGISPKGTKWHNWAENVECFAEGILYPQTEQEIVEIVLKAKAEGKRIRVVGEGHSFSRLIETDSYILSLRMMTGIINVDKDNKTATIWAGTSINKANEALFHYDVALRNLGDIDVQSLAGATATGTHGTGTAFGNVSTEIVDFTIVTAQGEILHCSRFENAELFNVGRVSLGVLGIITRMTLNVDKAYKLEYISTSANFTQTLQKLEDYNNKNRNFEFYYFPFSDVIQLKESNKTEKPVKNNKISNYFNAMFMENMVMQGICSFVSTFPSTCRGVSRAMAKFATKEHKIDHSHKIYATVRNVRFKEMEYNIPIEHFKECIQKFKEMVEKNNYFVFFPVECRFVKGDDIWLSPAYQRDSAYIAVHVYNKTPHEPYFPEVEALFMSYGGRPHWGKMHTRKADYLSTIYEKWNDFMALRQKMDPDGVFLTPYMKEMLGVK